MIQTRIGLGEKANGLRAGAWDIKELRTSKVEPDLPCTCEYIFIMIGGWIIFCHLQPWNIYTNVRRLVSCLTEFRTHKNCFMFDWVLVHSKKCEIIKTYEKNLCSISVRENNRKYYYNWIMNYIIYFLKILILKRPNVNILARKMLLTKSMVNFLKSYCNFLAFFIFPKHNTTLQNTP